MVFFRKLQELSFISRGFSRFTWHCPVQLALFCTVTSLKVLLEIVFGPDAKSLDADIFPQYTIADLNCGIIFIVLFSQEKALR